MSYVDELLEKSKSELIELAEEHGLDTEGNKPDIAERIARFEAGVPEPVESDDEQPVTDEPVADEPVADEPVADEPVADEPVVSGNDKVLLKYSGQAIAYEINGLRFGRQSPFRAVSESVADEILSGPRSKQFRIASPSEAKEFFS